MSQSHGSVTRGKGKGNGSDSSNLRSVGARSHRGNSGIAIMDFLAGYQKVRIERRGKIAQEYALIQKVYQDTYLAVKTTGGERPRKVFFINLKESERNK